MKKHIIFLFTLISMIGTNVWALEQNHCLLLIAMQLFKSK